MPFSVVYDALSQLVTQFWSEKGAECEEKKSRRALQFSETH